MFSGPGVSDGSSGPGGPIQKARLSVRGGKLSDWALLGYLAGARPGGSSSFIEEWVGLVDLLGLVGLLGLVCLVSLLG